MLFIWICGAAYYGMSRGHLWLVVVSVLWAHMCRVLLREQNKSVNQRTVYSDSGFSGVWSFSQRRLETHADVIQVLRARSRLQHAHNMHLKRSTCHSLHTWLRPRVISFVQCRANRFLSCGGDACLRDKLVFLVRRRIIPSFTHYERFGAEQSNCSSLPV